MKKLQLSVQDKVDGQPSPIEANLVTTWKQKDIVYDAMSGVKVDDISASVHIFRSTIEMFELSDQVIVNKFTRLQYTVTVSTSVERSGLCLFEDLPGEDKVDLSQCHEVNLSQDVDVPIDELLNGREALVHYIAFIQEGYAEAYSIISEIKIKQGENTDIYDENGCKDVNAITSGSGSSTLCTCTDGYISSNGGKTQGGFDSCVKCVLSDFCLFDGVLCSRNDECIASECEGNVVRRCKSRVSLKHVLNL